MCDMEKNYGIVMSSIQTKNLPKKEDLMFINMVEVAGFEPTASWSRTKRPTKLRYTSLIESIH